MHMVEYFSLWLAYTLVSDPVNNISLFLLRNQLSRWFQSSVLLDLEVKDHVRG